MRHAKLAYHLLHYPVQFFARTEARNVCPVFFADGFPVMAVHVRIVEEIPVPSPAIVENLIPFRHVIYRVNHSTKAHFLSCTRRGKRLIECRYENIVLFFDDQLLAVERQIEIADFIPEHRILLCSHIIHHQPPFRCPVRFENLFVLVFREMIDGAPCYFSFSCFKVKIISGGNGQRVSAFLETVNIDVHGARILFFGITRVRFNKRRFLAVF